MVSSLGVELNSDDSNIAIKIQAPFSNGFADAVVLGGD